MTIAEHLEVEQAVWEEGEHPLSDAWSRVLIY